jgi:hypothetical protein
VPDVRTEVTEIVTGLAMLGYQDVQRALEVRPRHITHVDEAVFAALDLAWASGRYATEFATAWDNGAAFARSPHGLRGRPPWTLEWKGHHKPASRAIETIPADLRVDHVYLVSCKYGSRILHNAGPTALFDHHLAPSGPIGRADWFEQVAPDAFRAVWQPLFQAVGLPAAVTPSATTQAQRQLIKRALDADPMATTSADYQVFVDDVSHGSAARWRSRLTSKAARSELYWRLLRMQAAPYFVLGARPDGSPLRYRIDTPWDFQRRYSVTAFDITPGSRGQPSVDWRAVIDDLDAVPAREVVGHVEIRWSHGKLNGSPEAKVYLDTDPASVPGYEEI